MMLDFLLLIESNRIDILFILKYTFIMLLVFYSQGKMAVDSLNKVDDSQTQNRKIREQLGDNAFKYDW